MDGEEGELWASPPQRRGGGGVGGNGQGSGAVAVDDDSGFEAASIPARQRPRGGGGLGGAAAAAGVVADGAAVGGDGGEGEDGDCRGGGNRLTWRVSTLHRRSQRMTGLGQGEEDDDREEDISFVPRTTTYSKLETISAAEIGVLVRLLYLTVAFATIYTVWALTMLRTTWVDDSYLRQSMLTGLSNRTLMDMARRTESLVVDVPPPRDSDQLLDPYRCITAMVLSGNPGGDSPVPDPCVALASASLPPSVALFGQTVQLVFAVLMTLVAIVYAVRIIRHRGHALVTHEQVWVLMLLVFGSLYINVPYTSWNIYDKINNSSGSGSYEISRVEQLWIIAEPFFRTVRDGAFTVSTLFFVWASMCSLRILDPRARLGWRFYIPKVVTLLVYYVAKWLADDKLVRLGIDFGYCMGLGLDLVRRRYCIAGRAFFFCAGDEADRPSAF